MKTKVGNTIPYSLFISDLHLCESRPASNKAFIHFLQHVAIHAQSLYILGDLFEYWVGDDSIEHHPLTTVLEAIRRVTNNGLKVYLLHGNRDFLIGQQFCKATGIILLSDPTLLTLYQTRVLISHGDALCTDDTNYQQFRTQVRSPDWITQFLAQPIEIRLAQVESLRKQSELAKSNKAMSIMDVNDEAVLTLIKAHDYPPLLIHGHTHRPNTHTYEVNGHSCERWVLGDWYDQASCLRLDENGCHSIVLDA